MRCVHEASMHEQNCFITLTYDDEHLPSDGSLHLKDFQDFMKRLRSRFVETRIRFFHAGEYGAKYRRPHYHACLFGIDFGDKRPLKVVNGHWLFTSADLAKCWKLGFSSVGAVTFESAAYVARYLLKKVTGDRADEHYFGCDEVTGAPVALVPEYTTMSRRPGIGRNWYDQFSADVFPSDDVVLMGGRRVRTPRFYDSIYESHDEVGFARMKAARRSFDKKDCSPERLKAREFCKQAEISRLPRRGDYET